MTRWITIAIVLVVLFGTIFTVKPTWRSSVIAYLNREQMPLWMSLALAVAAAAGTYWLAPIINQSFEFQKNRSTHLLQTVSDLNKLNVELAVETRKFNDALFYKSHNLLKVRGDLLDKITEMQWRLVDVSVIIKRSGDDANCVTDLSNELAGLQGSVNEARKSSDQETVIAASLRVGSATKRCMRVLYTASKLDIVD